MFSRKNSESNGVEIDHEWAEEITNLLTSAYSKQCRETGNTFQVFGNIFADEILFIASFANNLSLEKSPITLMLSLDINEEEAKKAKEILTSLVDVTGSIFDQIFADDDFYEYEINWQKESFNGKDIHFKITRENVALTYQANALLGDFDQ